ncbi:MAG: bifunctional nuclease family protein [Myxococcota bacterium]
MNNAPIVILREKDGGRILPIWIGVIEASAIAFELEQVKLSRPMTHDLLRTAIESLGGAVERIVVVDLRENTYFATVKISRNGETIEIDARPSDAIALALRTEAPVLCDSKVLEQAHLRQEQAAAEGESGEEEADAGDVGDDVEIDTGAVGGGAGGTVVEEEQLGPTPIVVDGRSPLEILESLDPKAFGKYKM